MTGEVCTLELTDEFVGVEGMTDVSDGRSGRGGQRKATSGELSGGHVR